MDRVLNGCTSICFHVVAQDGKAQPALFNAKSLNRTILFKYPNFSLASTEGGGATAARPIETAIFVPYDPEQLGLGGHGIYLRQRNYKSLMLQHLGLDLDGNDPAVLRDIKLLEEIDRIPSLDPFLLKPQVMRVFPDVDQRYFQISEEESASTRKIIASKVEPIIERALTDIPAELKRTHTNKFLAALWDPTLPEAALFIKAFGIQNASAGDIFEALKGISFYQWNINTHRDMVVETLKWLQSSETLPHDIRQNMHHKESLEMFRNQVSKSIRNVARVASEVFLEFEKAHALFLKDGDPGPFRQFLETVPKRYWLLGYSSTALAQVTFLFQNAMMQSYKRKLSFESTTELLSLMSLSLASEGAKEG